jgi:hypothetical protein
LPIFQFNPCCFGLVINNFYFLNISSNFHLSKKLGLPYYKKIEFSDDGYAKAKIISGKCKITYPIIRSSKIIRGSRLFQPIANHEILASTSLYNTDFAKNNISFNEKGVGKIFLENKNTFGDYSSFGNSEWIPKNIEDDNVFRYLFTKEILEYQLSLISNIYLGNIPEARKEIIKKRIYFAKKCNQLGIIEMENLLAKILQDYPN